MLLLIYKSTGGAPKKIFFFFFSLFFFLYSTAEAVIELPIEDLATSTLCQCARPERPSRQLTTPTFDGRGCRTSHLRVTCRTNPVKLVAVALSGVAVLVLVILAAIVVRRPLPVFPRRRLDRETALQSTPGCRACLGSPSPELL